MKRQRRQNHVNNKKSEEKISIKSLNTTVALIQISVYRFLSTFGRFVEAERWLLDNWDPSGITKEKIIFNLVESSVSFFDILIKRFSLYSLLYIFYKYDSSVCFFWIWGFHFLGTQFTVICSSFCCGDKNEKENYCFSLGNHSAKSFRSIEQTRFKDMKSNVVRGGENKTVKKHQREVLLSETAQINATKLSLFLQWFSVFFLLSRCKYFWGS